MQLSGSVKRGSANTEVASCFVKVRHFARSNLLPSTSHILGFTGLYQRFAIEMRLFKKCGQPGVRR